MLICAFETAVELLLLFLLCPVLFYLICVLPVLSIGIIFFSLFGITQHFIGLIELLEFAMCFYIIRIQVRVHFSCHFAVGLFDLFLCGRPGKAKDFVIVDICHS